MLTVALGLLAALVVLTTLVRLLEPRFAFFPMAGESVTLRGFGVAPGLLTPSDEGPAGREAGHQDRARAGFDDVVSLILEGALFSGGTDIPG